MPFLVENAVFDEIELTTTRISCINFLLDLLQEYDLPIADGFMDHSGDIRESRAYLIELQQQELYRLQHAYSLFESSRCKWGDIVH